MRGAAGAVKMAVARGERPPGTLVIEAKGDLQELRRAGRS